MRLGIYTTSQD